MSWLQALSAGASIFGGLFGGGQSSPNLNQAFGQGLQGQLGFLRQFGPQFMEQYRGMNPVFSGLEGMVLGPRANRSTRGCLPEQGLPTTGCSRSPELPHFRPPVELRWSTVRRTDEKPGDE